MCERWHARCGDGCDGCAGTQRAWWRFHRSEAQSIGWWSTARGPGSAERMQRRGRRVLEAAVAASHPRQTRPEPRAAPNPLRGECRRAARPARHPAHPQRVAHAVGCAKLDQLWRLGRPRQRALEGIELGKEVAEALPLEQVLRGGRVGGPPEHPRRAGRQESSLRPRHGPRKDRALALKNGALYLVGISADRSRQPACRARG